MNTSPIPDASHKIITVSELNRNVKTVLESAIPLLWVSGEISNIKRYPSGHWYFSLKDADAQVRCVMFRHKNRYLDWQPQDGVRVEILARVTVYEARGDYQLNVETMRCAGLGALYEAFEKLKAKLEKAGLFDPVRKKKPPTFPRQIGIVTSPATAALRDVLITLKRRVPMLPVIIYPAPVQGKDAAQRIAAAIATASERRECDVLILCRGGGSIEDLWAFNEETVAQAIVGCTIPIICGVGHETDFTIAEFVADQRAPTPTGAAELASSIPISELRQQLKRLHYNLRRAVMQRIEFGMQKIDLLGHRLSHPGQRVQNQSMHLRHLQERLTGSWHYQTDKRWWKITELNSRLQRTPYSPAALAQLHRQCNQLALRLQQAFTRHLELLSGALQQQQIKLTHLNPQTILKRGYSITYSSEGEIVRDANQLRANEQIQVKFEKGLADAVVIDTQNK